MRLLLSALLLALLPPSAASARCGDGHTTRYPASGATDVPVDTAVVLMVSGGHADVPPLNGPADRAALVAGSDRVPLTVALDSYVPGARSTRTLVLRPARRLAPNRRYRMEGEPIPGHDTAISFTTSDATSAAPELRDVQVGEFSAMRYGCGPAHLIPLTLDLAPRAEALFARVRLARSRADLTAGRFAGEILIEVPRNSVVQFGHGMCGGNWALEPGDSFFASVTVVNAALLESAPYEVELRATP